MNEIGYRRLKVWSEAHNLVLMVYRLTKHFPNSELFGFTNQLRRAVISIPANIVEGYARQSKKEFRQFLFISQGSLAETEYYLQLAKDLKYISEDEFIQTEIQRQLVGNLLYGFIRSLAK
jgi:four helix bundle protein